MNTGKIGENVLKRSVLRQIKSNNNYLINGAGVGTDCALFSLEKSDILCTAINTDTMDNPKRMGLLINRTVNNIYASAGEPIGLSLSILLPEGAEEQLLKELMKEADKVCSNLGIALSGGHTEVSEAVQNPVVSASVLGYRKEHFDNNKEVSFYDKDIVVSKWIALEQTVEYGLDREDRLLSRFPQRMIDEAKGYADYLSIASEAAGAVKSGVLAMHDLSQGGIFAGLWEIAERLGVGLTVNMKDIPIKQYTVEMCELMGDNPYEAPSCGSLIMITEDAGRLIENLEKLGVYAAYIGRTTKSNDRVIINDDERRYLEMPR